MKEKKNELIPVSTQNSQEVEHSTFTPKQQKLLDNWFSEELLGKSICEKCETLEFDRRSYYTWIKDSKFLEALENKYKEVVRERMPKVYDSIYKKAKEGDIKACRLWLERFDKEFKIKHEVDARYMNLNIDANVTTNDLEYLQDLIRKTNTVKKK